MSKEQPGPPTKDMIWRSLLWSLLIATSVYSRPNTGPSDSNGDTTSGKISKQPHSSVKYTQILANEISRYTFSYSR